jgi:large subunit ribosomal protein L27
MAHKKGVGSSRNGRDSNPKYRGIKKFGGEKVIAGNIILRQCGTVWHPGKNVGLGTDYTIYSLIDGVVKFEHKKSASIPPSAPKRPQRKSRCVIVGRAPFLYCEGRFLFGARATFVRTVRTATCTQGGEHGHLEYTEARARQGRTGRTGRIR